MSTVGDHNNSGYVDNWQAGKTVTECNLHMLTTEDCSDVIFRVGSEKHVVRAHRYVLVSRSCVFHAMFCGPLAEKGEVTIPEVEVSIFREFLRFVYTDNANITAENVIGLLYTSRKYAVDGLVKTCTDLLDKFLSNDVCNILEQCHGYGELDLEQKALNTLTEAGEKVIKSKGFLDLCSDCFGAFLRSNKLRLKEEQVFEATMSWTKHVCQIEDIPFTHNNIRDILGEMVYEIRFANMSLVYLTDVVGQFHVLSDTERNRIIDKTMRPSVDISPFNSTRREGTPTFPCRYVHRFRGNTIARMPPGTHAISLSVSRKIFLVGCQLYGPCFVAETRCSVRVDVINRSNDVMLESFSNTLNLQGNPQVNDVMFPHAVLLDTDFTYILCVTISDTYTCRGTGGQRSVYVDGVDFNFSGTVKSKAGTDVSDGQIPGLIFKQIQ